MSKKQSSHKSHNQEQKHNSKLDQGNTNSRKNNNKEHNKKSSTYEVNLPYYYLVPIFIILCIIPLIVRLKVYNPNMSQFQWFSDTDYIGDFFLYYKQWTLIYVTCIMALIIAYKACFDPKVVKFSPIFIPLAIYAILAFLSAVFSDYNSFSFLGSFEQFESVFALLGYCISTYYVFLFVRSEAHLKLIMTSLVAVAIIMCIFGLFQFFGRDLFATNTLYHLIVPAIYQSDSGLDFMFEANRVYLTLYNPNYVGVYVALVVPIILVMTFFQKNIIRIIISIITLIGLFITLLGAKSLAGFIGIMIAMLFIPLCMWRHLIKRFYFTVPITIILIISLYVINNQSDQEFLQKMKDMVLTTKTDYALTEIDTNDDNISFKYKGNKMFVQYKMDENQSATFLPFDENYQVVACNYDEASNSVVVSDERFLGISFGVNKDNAALFYIMIDGQQWYFTNQEEDGTYYYINRMGKLDKLITAPSAIFTGYESFASTRGYIWSRTFPLLKENIILGSGPDTFTMEYPQQDYMNLQRYNFGDSILTKPHSLYLQIAVQTGLLSLVAFLIFYGIYFISSIRLYIKGRFNNYYAQTGIAIFAGTLAYMVTGFSNDSSITTAPIFWVLIGVGIAVNSKAKPLIYKEIAEVKLMKREAKMRKANMAETKMTETKMIETKMAETKDGGRTDD